MLVPQLVSLLEYWRKRYGVQELPERPHFSERQFEPWARHVAWIELTRDDSLLIRTFGMELIRRYGRQAQGEAVDDLAVDIASSLREVIWRVVTTRAPVESTASVALGHKPAVFAELGLPMSRVDRRVNLILIASYEVSRPEAANR